MQVTQSIVTRSIVALLFVSLVLASLLVILVALGALPWHPRTEVSSSAAPASTVSLTDMEQVLKEKLDAYNKRADDLQKAASLLLGLSTIYAIVLAFSAYTSVQNNLQQADKSIARLEGLLQELPRNLKEVKDDTKYSTQVTMARGSLALALQGKYLGDAALAIIALKDLRDGAYATDRFVNLLLGRLHKALGSFENAEGAMTSFIDRKVRLGEVDDTAIGDAYYNRACYRSLRWASATSTEKSVLQTGIEQDLGKIFSVDQSYKSGIQSDPDFQYIKDQEWFKNLVRA